MLAKPAELALWRHHFKNDPPGDPVLRVLVANIGILLQTWASGGKQPNPRHWFFWYEVPNQKKRTVRQIVDDPQNVAYREALVKRMTADATG